MSNKFLIQSNGKTYEVLFDEDDQDLIESYRWRILHTGKNTYVQSFYNYVKDEPEVKYLHRLIVGEPVGKVVDHINHNGLDNRRSNLRSCTSSQNQMNKSCITGKSKYKGVSLHKASSKFEVKIQKDNKQFHIGLFESEEEAARAYDKKAEEVFGEFAFLNFPKRPLA